MRKACPTAVVLMTACGGLFADPVSKNVDYDGFVVQAGAYREVFEHQNNGVYVGAWNRESPATLFEYRCVFKWDLTDILAQVPSAQVTIPINWTSLTGNLAGSIMISTFATATSGDVTGSDAFDAAAIDTKVAFASTTTGNVNVDVTDWLNAAIAAGQTMFCVRLEAGYLFEEPVQSLLPYGTSISWLYAAESGYPAAMVYDDPSVTLSDTFDDNDYTNNPTWFVLQQDLGGIGLESSHATPAFAADGSSVGNISPAAGMLNFSPAGAGYKRICLSLADAAQTTGAEFGFDLYQSNSAAPGYFGFCMELADSYSNQSYYTDGYLTSQYYTSPGGGMSGFRSYNADGAFTGGVANASLLNGWRRMVLRFNPATGVTMMYDGRTVASWPNFKHLTRVDQLILYHTGTLSWFVDNVTARFLPASELSKGHRVLLQKGLQIQGLSFGEPITAARFIESNLSGINRWVYPATLSRPEDNESIPLPSFIPQWSRCSNPANQDVLTEPEYDPNGVYLPRMVNYQYRDEVNGANFSDLDPYKEDPAVDEGKLHLEKARAWFNTYRPMCPSVILHTNQWDTQVSEAIMHKYMAVCQPDMVSFDQYYFRGSDPADGSSKIYGGSPILLYQALQKYRLLGLGGNDGTGRLPIPYGVYAQTCVGDYVNYHGVSESEMRLNVFAAWTFGFKWVCSFVYMMSEQAPTQASALFTGRYDTSPTSLFTSYAKMNGESRNLGSALVRLISTDIRFIPGKHTDALVSENLGSSAYSASGSYSSCLPALAFDGGTSGGSAWNAGGYTPQWVEVDLGQSRPLNRVKLYAEQDRSGRTVHQVYVKDTPIQNNRTGATLVSTFDGVTDPGSVLEAAVNATGRYVQVYTSTSPTWVAWREVQLFGARDNAIPTGVLVGIAAADPHLNGISVTNAGTKNDGLPGDVIVGLFKVLDESFDGDDYSGERYFMIANGLSDAAGTAAETQQRIRLTFSFGSSGITQLQRLSRDTGYVETVALISDGGANYHLDLVLDGGTGDLFKYKTGAPFVGASPAPPLPGDANRNGVVSFEDFAALQNHYNQSVTGDTWAQGDFDDDGQVTFEDFAILQNHYGESQVGAGPAADNVLAATPCSLVALALLILAGLAFVSVKNQE